MQKSDPQSGEKQSLKIRNRILITGASSGLGRGMALEFARAGHDLALCARRVERLEELREKLKIIAPDIKVEIRKLDVNQYDEVFKVFDAFKTSFGGLDRIIINAGIGKGASIGTGYFHANKLTAETNFVAVLAQAEAAMEIFREQNAGHLVFISSISAVRGFRRAMTVYAATKAAVSSLAEGISIDVGNTPIKVSCIHPGFIRSEINEKVEKVPFIVSTEKGCRSLGKAIQRERKASYAPFWPWGLMHWFIRIAPQSVLAKMS